MSNQDIRPNDEGKRAPRHDGTDDQRELDVLARQSQQNSSRDNEAEDDTLGTSTTASGVGEDDFGAGIGNTRLGMDDTDMRNPGIPDIGTSAGDTHTTGGNTGDLTGGGVADIQDEARYTDTDDLGDRDEGQTVRPKALQTPERT